MKPLEGIKVIELASVLAGPAVGMFFAELGAQVIKVENASTGGDMTRHWRLASEDRERPVSAYFSSVNYGKEYRLLDLKKESDLSAVNELIQDADIVLNNMRPSAVERFGLDYKRLSTTNPSLILCELRGFMKDEGKVAFDVVLQAETGYISMTGSPDHAAKLPVAFIDLMAAHQMKEAILLALYQREKDGRGAHITCSLEESALSSLANQASNTLMEGHVPGRIGTLHPNIAPYGELVKSQDGVEFILAIGTQGQWQALCDWLDAEELAKVEQFVSNPMRVKHRKVLLEKLLPYFSGMKAADIERDSEALKIPLGRVRTLDEVLQSPASQKLLRKEVIAGVATERLSAIAFSIDRPGDAVEP